jgi:hypothetical protein
MNVSNPCQPYLCSRDLRCLFLQSWKSDLGNFRLLSLIGRSFFSRTKYPARHKAGSTNDSAPPRAKIP